MKCSSLNKADQPSWCFPLFTPRGDAGNGGASTLATGEEAARRSRRACAQPQRPARHRRERCEDGGSTLHWHRGCVQRQRGLQRREYFRHHGGGAGRHVVRGQLLHDDEHSSSTDTTDGLLIVHVMEVVSRDVCWTSRSCAQITSPRWMARWEELGNCIP